MTRYLTYTLAGCPRVNWLAVMLEPRPTRWSRRQCARRAGGRHAASTGVSSLVVAAHISAPPSASAAESGRLARSCRPVMGGRFNCIGAWSCLRRAGLPRSLLSPPGEAFWPSGPMDHGVQRRERGGGQAAGPAARPELAAPSAAAVPREIPTCSASLLFRLSGPQAAACHRQFLRPSSSMRSAPGRSEVMRQPGRWRFPCATRGAAP